ncbi:MAG: hypothetical protein WBG17_06225, partial [Burkholderiaceae bacterium]
MTITIRRLDAAQPDFDAQLRALLAFEAGEDAAIDGAAAAILADVRQRGDAAVLENRFGDVAAAFGDCVDRHELRLHVGRKARV